MEFERFKAMLPYAQFAAVIVTIAVGSHKLIEIYTKARPAIAIHSINTQDEFRGASSRLFITFSKFRPCLPKNAVLTLIDQNGELYTTKVEWGASFPLRNNIRATMMWTVPANVPKGEVIEGVLEVTHGDCADGKKDPQSPVSFPITGFVAK